MKLEMMTQDDYPFFLRLYQDSDLMKMITGDVLSERELKEKWYNVSLMDNQRGFGLYNVYNHNKLIGMGCLKPYDKGVEVGYIILKEYWNRGYATKLCQMLVEKAKKMSDEKVVAYINPNNIASKNVLLKNGFESLYKKDDEEFLMYKENQRITGYTGLYGIVANPIQHSFSPMMHNTAFHTLGIDDVYLAFEIAENQLQDFITSVKTINIKGFNVSMPYKFKIIQYLDELSAEAELCQAVNTVKCHDGKLIGHISDGKGFFLSCEEKNWHIKNQKVVVIGAGGAANAIIVEAALLGAKEIIVYNRSDKPYIRELNDKLECSIQLKSLQDLKALKEDLLDTYLLIQTTNVGMNPNSDDCLIPDHSYLPMGLKVADIIYKPAQTKLLKMASDKGLDFMNGEGMILYQGAVSFEYWTNQKMPVKAVKKALGME